MAQSLLERANDVARDLGRQQLTGECVVLAAISPDLPTLAHRGEDPPPPAQESPEMLPFSSALDREITSRPTPLTLEELIRMSLADGASTSSEVVDLLAFQVRTRPFFVGGPASP
jgi:hypothetical protein